MPFRRTINTIYNYSHLHSRPEKEERLFQSKIIEEVIENVSKDIADPDLKRMFIQCFPNTLDTTVYYAEEDYRPDTFIVTGDIPAMWLRDSTNQMWPYLPLVDEDPELQNLFIGLINRQAGCVLTDPYANAFERSLQVWERKLELDSLASFLRLSFGYFQKTNDLSPFGSNWLAAVNKIIDVLSLEQNTLNKENTDLLFHFRTSQGHHHPAVRLKGYGYPGKKCGLVRCVFRPSDDE